MRKQTMFLLMFMVAMGTLFAFGQKDFNDRKTLVVYSSHTIDWIGPIIEEFEKKNNLEVELVGGGTGELFSRLEAEAGDPYADIIWGGGPDSHQANLRLLQPYANKQLSKTRVETRDPGNRWHGTSIDPMVIIYNPTLVDSVHVPKGWGDLLDPHFRGRIAYADPLRSGSSFMALLIQLLSMGGDNETGWAYVESFIDNLDGRLLDSSPLVFDLVADGTFLIGVTYEEAGLRQEHTKGSVKVVYPVEGSSKVPSPVAIVKGTKHLENAQKFVDYLVSKEVQEQLGTLYRRSVRTDVQLPSFMVPSDELGEIPFDPVWAGQSKNRILERWENLVNRQ